MKHEYERVWVCLQDGRDIPVGEFYGYVAAAIIDEQERWIIGVGCGLVLYRLREPFGPYECYKEHQVHSDQWWEAHRYPPHDWSIEAVWQVTEDTVRFVVDVWSEHAGVCELNVESRSIRKLLRKRGELGPDQA